MDDGTVLAARIPITATVAVAVLGTCSSGFGLDAEISALHACEESARQHFLATYGNIQQITKILRVIMPIMPARAEPGNILVIQGSISAITYQMLRVIMPCDD